MYLNTFQSIWPQVCELVYQNFIDHINAVYIFFYF